MGNQKTVNPTNKKLFGRLTSTAGTSEQSECKKKIFRSEFETTDRRGTAATFIATQNDHDSDIVLLKYRSMSLSNLNGSENQKNGRDCSTSKSNEFHQLYNLEKQMANIELSLDKANEKNTIKIINGFGNQKQVIEQKIQQLSTTVQFQKDKIKQLKLYHKNEQDARKEELQLLLNLEELASLKAILKNTVNTSSNTTCSALFNCIRGFEHVSLHAIDICPYDNEKPSFDVQEKGGDLKGLWVQWCKHDVPLEYNDRIIEVNGVFLIGKNRQDFVNIAKHNSVLHLVILRIRTLPTKTVNFLTSLSNEQELAHLKVELIRIRNEANQNNMIKDYLWDENLKLTNRLNYLENKMDTVLDLLKKGPALKKNSAILLNRLLIKNHNEFAEYHERDHHINGYMSDFVNYESRERKEKNKRLF